MPAFGRPVAILALVASLSCSAAPNDPFGRLPELTLARLGSTSDSFVATAVTDVAMDPRGRVVAADWYGPSLFVVTPDGRVDRVVQSRGEGPGEFRAIRNVWVDSVGNVGVWDPELSRVTYFAEETWEPVSTLRIDQTPDPENTFSRPFSILAGRNGTVAALMRSPVIGTEVAALRGRMDVLASVGPSGRVGSRIAQFPSPARLGAKVGGQLHIAPDPLGGSSFVGAGPNGELYLVRGETGRIERWHGGRWATFADVGPSRMPISDTEREALAGSAGHVFERTIAEHPAQLWPVLFGFEIDQSSGVLWVQVDGRPNRPQRWMLLGPDGRPAHRVVIPNGRSLAAVNAGFVATLSYDSLDVPTIETWQATAR